MPPVKEHCLEFPAVECGAPWLSGSSRDLPYMSSFDE